MNRPRSGTSALLFLISFTGSGRQLAAPNDQMMTLDVVVADKEGHAVGGLQQQDFQLFDNKQLQRIVSFAETSGRKTAEDQTIKVILLVDEINASPPTVALEKKQIEKFLRKNGGRLPAPVTLRFFSHSGAPAGNSPSQDGAALIEELNRDKNPQHGSVGQTDRINLSIRTVADIAEYEATLPGRKLLIWISPGWPMLTGQSLNLNATTMRGIFKNIVALTEELRQAQITLYSLDPLGTDDAGTLRTSYYREFLQGVSEPKQANYGDLALPVLATHSGGRVLNSSNDLANEIGTCMAEADNFYVVSFKPPAGDGLK